VEGITWLELTIGTAGKMFPALVWSFDAPKQGHLQRGLVPVPDELAAYAAEFGIQNSEEPTDETPIGLMSQDPVLLELARRLWVNEYTAGEPVEIPTREEAEAARWEINAATGTFRRVQI